MTTDGLIAALVRALRDEEQARAQVRRVMCEQAALIRELKEAGLVSSRIAHRVAAARGVVLTVRDRRRLAECLRGRARRWTVRPADPGSPPGPAPFTGSPFVQRAMPPAPEEDMARRLIRKTVTIEQIVDPDELARLQGLEGLETADDDTGPEEDEPEEENEETPRRRRR